MKNRWKALSARIDALNMRERAMIFVTVLGSVLVLADSLWLSPAQFQQKQLEASFKKQTSELSELRKQLLSGMPVKPEAGSGLVAPSERMLLSNELEAVNQEIARMTAAPAVDLPKVLVEFLRRQEGLVLERTATLDFANPKVGSGMLIAKNAGAATGLLAAETATNPFGTAPRQGVAGKNPGPFRDAAAIVEKILPLATQKAANDNMAQQLKDLKAGGTPNTETASSSASLNASARLETSNVSRQGLELTVSGPYLALMRYVQTLEKALPTLRWGPMKLVSDKMTSRLTLQVFLVELSP